MAMTPMGAFIQKIASQLAQVVRTPPRATPTAIPRPPMAPQSARPRAFCGPCRWC